MFFSRCYLQNYNFEHFAFIAFFALKLKDALFKPVFNIHLKYIQIILATVRNGSRSNR
jgi:hypothetical protein